MDDRQDKDRAMAMAVLMLFLRDGYEPLAAARVTCALKLSEADRAALLFVLIRSLPGDTAREAILCALETEKPPYEFLFDLAQEFDAKAYLDRVDGWTQEASPIALKAMLLSCFRAVAPEVKASFKKWILS